MHYFIAYTESGKEPFAGQIGMLEAASSQFKSIYLVYSKRAFFYKIIWLLFCKLFFSSHLGFMFLGIGYRAYSNNQLLSFKDLNFSAGDTLVICNQTLPLSIIYKAKKNGARIIRWSDLPLCELFDQRYAISGIPRLILLSIEKKVMAVSECFYTNQRALDIHNQFNHPKARGIITRAIKDVFFIEKKYTSDGSIPFHIIFLGVDFKRKKLEQAIKIQKELRKNYLVDLVIIGPSSIDFDYDKSCTHFYGNLITNEIVTLLSNIKSRAFINIVFTKDEGAPIATLELQAIGAICFALKGSGATTYLADPSHNQYISQVDLLENLKKLFNDDVELGSQQKLAKDFAFKFSKEVVSEKILKI